MVLLCRLLVILSLWCGACSATTTYINCSTYENLPPNTAVCDVMAKLANITGAPDCSGGSCSFSIPSGSMNFVIDNSSGVITTLRSLDRETLEGTGNPVAAQLAVQISPGYFQSVQILVYDQNDQAPLFPSAVESHRLIESTPLENHLFIQAAVDEDAGQNGNVTYAIESGNEDGAFQLVVFDQSTLYLTPAKSLDRETIDHYSLTISAHDHGNPPLWSYHVVNITIDDANDHFPQFTKKDYRASLEENSPAKTLLFQVSAVDPDLGNNSLIRYSIKNEQFKAEDHFTVDPVSGEVQTTDISFDFDTYTLGGRNYYLFWLFASDSGSSPRTSEVEVRVDILDVNDEAPDITVIFYPGGNIKDYKVWEDEATDGRSLAIVTITDPDKGSANTNNITSWLEGGEGFFHFDPATGSLTLAKSLDYETKKDFSMKLVASDNGNPPLTSEFRFNVTVLDKNDNYPTFNDPSYTGVVLENSPVGKEVIRVQAHDNDEGVLAEITYSIKSVHVEITNTKFSLGWFTINATTGWVEVARPDIDRETVAVVTLVVEAANSGSHHPLLSTNVNVTIYIEDENDQIPVFIMPDNHNHYDFSVQEDQPIGTVVGQVQALDADTGHNSEVHYSLQSENETFFAIDSKTGTIRTTGQLDYERVKEFSFQIIASDGRTAPQSSVSVMVRVVDVNDNAPKFTRTSPVYVETSQLDDSDRLLTLKAIDPDTGDHERVIYQLQPFSSEESLFTINRDTGVISALYPLTHVKPQNYTYIASATDGSHTSLIKIIVKVVPPGGETAQPVTSKREDGITSTLTILVIVLAVLFILMVSAAVLFVFYSRGYRCHSKHDVERGKPDLRTIARRSSSRVQFATEDILCEYEVSKRSDPEGQNTPDKEEGKNEVFLNYPVVGMDDVNNRRSRKPLQASDVQELQREADEGSDAESESTDSGHHTADSVTTPSSIRLPPGANTFPSGANTVRDEGTLTSHL